MLFGFREFRRCSYRSSSMDRDNFRLINNEAPFMNFSLPALERKTISMYFWTDIRREEENLVD